jgi:hypothetical protein
MPPVIAGGIFPIARVINRPSTNRRASLEARGVGKAPYTGFIVDGEEDAVRAVREVSRLDRRAIRARFEERFTAVRMAREYEARYRELVTEAEAEARVLKKASAK